MKTEITYVCSADRHQQLSISIGTLLSSGSTFDAVTVFCVGKGSEGWSFSDPRISVRPVAPLYGAYFYGNKLHIADCAAERVIFLDTDTLVLSSIDSIWRTRSQARFMARVASAYGGPRWDAERWRTASEAFGAPETPLYNAGVLIFQGGAHREIRAPWDLALRRYLEKVYPLPYPDERQPEQFGLSLALGKLGITRSDLTPMEHGYGWPTEPKWLGDYERSADRSSADAPVIFHTGNSRYEEYARRLGFFRG